MTFRLQELVDRVDKPLCAHLVEKEHVCAQSMLPRVSIAKSHLCNVQQ